MGKKLILSLVFVFATGTMMNANTSNGDLSKKIETYNCASYARGIIMDAAEEYDLDISSGGSHYSIMMEAYHAIYADCYNN